MEQEEAFTGGPPEQTEPNGPAGAQVQAAVPSEAADQPGEPPVAPQGETGEAAGAGGWTRWLRANWPLLAGALVALAAAAGVFVLVKRQRAWQAEGIIDLARERSRRLGQEAARRRRGVARFMPRFARELPGLPRPGLRALELEVELPRLPQPLMRLQPGQLLPVRFLAWPRRADLGATAGAGLRQVPKRIRGLLAAA